MLSRTTAFDETGRVIIEVSVMLSNEKVNLKPGSKCVLKPFFENFVLEIQNWFKEFPY